MAPDMMNESRKNDEPRSGTPRIVVSAVNICDMGPLTILREVLSHLATKYAGSYEIIALVHRRSLVDIPNIRYVEFPAIKRSWLKRIKFEYLDLKNLAREFNAELWLSLHDMTPNVIAAKRAVYCHTPNPFYRFSWRDALRDPKFGLFVLFYGFLYAINIRRNNFVIVQQDWIRKEFERRYGLNNVVVAYPVVRNSLEVSTASPGCIQSSKKYFFYPCYPRIFKNAETVLEAASILERRGIDDFEFWLTFDGTENGYAASMVRRYGGSKAVRFLGLLSYAEVQERYRQAHCLVFPSKLETWGLPITEFKPFCKPILAADRPYARETVGAYDQVAFFDPADPGQLAELMQSMIEGTIKFAKVSAPHVSPPFSRNWDELFDLMLAPAHAISSNGDDAR